MKKQFLSISALIVMMIGLIIFIEPIMAQTSKRDIKIDLHRLRVYSANYDAYREFNQHEYAEVKEGHRKKYIDQIDKIKRGPNRDLYIQFLDEATGKDSLEYKNQIGMHYTYANPIMVHRRKNMTNMFEYLKVVKYSLFTMDKDELLLPNDVPFLKGTGKY
ncbi:hypothetical protein ACFX5U_08465 [Sphingobacterium sp. SG20118]|uniref:hypothetical protein n=1 Tax=Sphingobacterium sp. SG20118 TaxID=3367156 RepID=UPI0037DFC6BE